MVCDPLKEDGITKGLYGLCVAFCEAQDIADENTPITEAELDALEELLPSGRLLANYNKKKDKANNPLDPPMPCVLVQEPCPCWSSAEIAAIDGYQPDGTNTLTLNCQSNPNQARISEAIETGSLGVLRAQSASVRQFCTFTNTQMVPSITRTKRRLTPDEVIACEVSIADQCRVINP
jgi:hypothetical protein